VSRRFAPAFVMRFEFARDLDDELWSIDRIARYRFKIFSDANQARQLIDRCA
jgi:hypothetical protein